MPLSRWDVKQLIRALDVAIADHEADIENPVTADKRRRARLRRQIDQWTWWRKRLVEKLTTHRKGETIEL